MKKSELKNIIRDVIEESNINSFLDLNVNQVQEKYAQFRGNSETVEYDVKQIKIGIAADYKYFKFIKRKLAELGDDSALFEDFDYVISSISELEPFYTRYLSDCIELFPEAVNAVEPVEEAKLTEESFNDLVKTLSKMDQEASKKGEHEFCDIIGDQLDDEGVEYISGLMENTILHLIHIGQIEFGLGKQITEEAKFTGDVKDIDVDTINPDKKDYERVQGLEFRKQFGRTTFKGSGGEWGSEASKMAKLITDPIKLVRRAKAVAATWGGTRKQENYTGYYSVNFVSSEGFAPFVDRLKSMGFTKDQISKISSFDKTMVEESVSSDVFYFNDGDDAIEISADMKTTTLNLTKQDYNKLQKLIKNIDGVEASWNGETWFNKNEKMYVVDISPFYIRESFENEYDLRDYSEVDQDDIDSYGSDYLDIPVQVSSNLKIYESNKKVPKDIHRILRNTLHGMRIESNIFEDLQYNEYISLTSDDKSIYSIDKIKEDLEMYIPNIEIIDFGFDRFLIKL